MFVLQIQMESIMKPFWFFLIACIMSTAIEGRQNSTEIYLLDAYVTPEVPYVLKISFFTSEPVKSKIMVNNEYEIRVESEYKDNHNLETQIRNYKFDSTVVPFYIEVVNREGIISKSEIYDFELPENNELLKGEGSGLFTMCCLGGIIFGLPSAALLKTDNDDFFSLTKEIPLISFYSGGYNYPAGVLSLEYSYIFNYTDKHHYRLGYKHFIELDCIEFISPGLNAYANFKGQAGISPEISIGWLKVYNVFTIYTRYRYTTNLNDSKHKFNEFSVGLFSSFFTFSL
ncbi:MAG: hypothetical protein JW995_10940 [Melioribacteraceae bacterium]|nr:hypothetical protein [Melioribacteraceae bacterium]